MSRHALHRRYGHTGRRQAFHYVARVKGTTPTRFFHAGSGPILELGGARVCRVGAREGHDALADGGARGVHRQVVRRVLRLVPRDAAHDLGRSEGALMPAIIVVGGAVLVVVWGVWLFTTKRKS